MAKERKEKIPPATVDALSSELINTINTQFKDNAYTAAYFLADPAVATDVKDWISTGCTILDLAISNKPNGGHPCSKIIEITGLEACVTRDTEITVQILD